MLWSYLIKMLKNPNILVLFVVTTLFVVLSSSNGQAEELESSILGDNWYVSLFGGASNLEEFDINSTGSAPPLAATSFKSENGTKSGFIFGIAVGKEVMPNLRGELEVSFFENDIKSINFPGFPPSVSATGHVNSVNILANVWRDFDAGNGFKPYVGGGVGIGFVDAKTRATGGVFDEFDDSAIGFAFQVGTGFKIAITEIIEADIGYRFRGVTGVTLKSEFPTQVNQSTNIFGHYIQAGITIKLGGM